MAGSISFFNYQELATHGEPERRRLNLRLVPEVLDYASPPCRSRMWPQGLLFSFLKRILIDINLRKFHSRRQLPPTAHAPSSESQRTQVRRIEDHPQPMSRAAAHCRWPVIERTLLERGELRRGRRCPDELSSNDPLPSACAFS